MNYLADNKRKIIAFYIILYMLFIIVLLPAKLVPYFIPASEGVNMTGLQGTLWNGQASQVTYKQQLHVNNVKWSVNWFSLFLLKIKLSLAFNNSKQISAKGDVAIGFSGISLDDIMITSNANELIKLSKEVIPATLSGDVSIYIKHASQGKPYCSELNAQINWKDALVTSSSLALKLNNPIIDIACDKGEVIAKVRQDSAEITTNATGRLKAGGIYQLNGPVKEKDKLDPNLKQALSFIGSKGADGSVPFNYNGKL